MDYVEIGPFILPDAYKVRVIKDTKSKISTFYYTLFQFLTGTYRVHLTVGVVHSPTTATPEGGS